VKKWRAHSFCTFILIVSTCSLHAEETDTVVRLLELLKAKGIITEQEASDLQAAVSEDKPTETEQDSEVQPKAAEKPKPPPIPLNHSFASVKEKLSLGGDLRLRYDSQRRDLGNGQDWDRRRPRFRLRFGLKAQPTETTEVGLRLASGSGFQNTTNQSFGEHARGKKIFIDRAWGSWQPTNWFKVIGGKHENIFFTSPLVWDPDVNLEGASQAFSYRGENFQLFSNLTQFVIGELDLKGISNSDPIMLGYQGGFSVNAAKGATIEAGTSYYDYRHLDLFSPAGLGDRTTFIGYNQAHGQQMVFNANGNLLNEFGVFDLGAELRLTKLGPMPWGFFGHYIKNFKSDIAKLQREGAAVPGSDPADLAAYGSDNRDSGYQFGVGWGYREKKGDLHLQYFYQVLEDYAFPAVFVDSDFHGGGTNNRGHRARVNYFLTDNIYLQGVFFFTKRDNEAKDGKQDENRTQLDIVFKF
jgi:hypothetical protein